MIGRQQISTQAQWFVIRDDFPNKSSYRKFSERYEFDPGSRIIVTGGPIEEVVRANNIHRRNVYETCFKYQGTVAEVDALAKTLPGKAETNGNLFIGLYEDLIRFFD